MANPWTLSSTPHRVLWTIVPHTSLRRIPTIVHTQNGQRSISSIRLPSDRLHLHPSVASQQPLPTRPPSHPSGCSHPRNGQRAISSIQHRAPALADPSNDQCPHIALLPSTTQQVDNGPSRTFDIASERSSVSASQRHVPATIIYTCPCHCPACVSEWLTGPLIHSTLCPRGRPHPLQPNDYHPTQALPHQSEHRNLTSSRLPPPLSSRHCAPAIVSIPVPAPTARTYPIASQ
jgi:hypothetical protein